MKKLALRTTWNNEPIKNPKRVEIGLHFTNDQYEKLIRGIIPHQMEDKWFVFYEDKWLYFHRSWTGYGIYKAELLKVLDGYIINEFWAERDKAKYSNENDKSDAENISFLIAEGLLGVDVQQIYIASNIKSNGDVVNAWSNFGNLLFSQQQIDMTDKIRSVLFGVAIGDSLGVPFEFNDRQSMVRKPVTDMVGFGTHHQPLGTFSDDSSLTFCLAEALTEDFNLNTIGQNFVEWYHNNYWTARGEVFDIGRTTRQAISRLRDGMRPDIVGDTSSISNGNGSLMRILPLLFYLLDKPICDRFEITKQVSSLTHGHIRSAIACFYYLEFTRNILDGVEDKFQIYKNLKDEFAEFLNSISIDPNEIKLFDRLIIGNIHESNEDQINSSGYVLHTLEASIWCLLTTGSYQEAVLKAVNLGGDTDTTGAVTGGLAGLFYGFKSIPTRWIINLARKDDIEDLARRLGRKLNIK